MCKKYKRNWGRGGVEVKEKHNGVASLSRENERKEAKKFSVLLLLLPLPSPPPPTVLFLCAYIHAAVEESGDLFWESKICDLTHMHAHTPVLFLNTLKKFLFLVYVLFVCVLMCAQFVPFFGHVYHIVITRTSFNFRISKFRIPVRSTTNLNRIFRFL